MAKLFGHFNRAANFIAQRIATLIEKGQIPELNDRIKDLLINHFDDSSLEVEASSHLQFETEFAGVDVLKVTFMPGFQVIAADEDTIDVALEFTCHIRFKADFSWSTWDSIDREDVPMGSDTISVEEKDSFLEVIATFERNFDDVPDIIELETSVAPDIPDFGDVEPDWRGEE
jgi:hypothetical protein